MLRKIKRAINHCFAKELQSLRRIDYILYYLFYKARNPVNDRQILICSESRDNLSGNLKFIDEKIDKTKFDVIYSMKSSIIQRRSQRQKRQLCKYLATSKYVLIDDFMPALYPLPIRRETRFIQVWHAMGAFKRVGFSRLGKIGGPSPRSLSHRNYTDVIVSSESIRHNYSEAFGISAEKVHAIGTPRTDVFFDEKYKRKIRERLYSKYPKLNEKKIVLFAPTFRGNGVKTAYYDYSWISFKKLQDELGDEYAVIIKMHPFIKNMPEEELDDNFYINLSDEREINDLLFITDVLVTDYSSVIFEASLMDICTVFFVPDYDEYVESRDFYYPYSEYTYGNVAKCEEELIGAIKKQEIDKEKLAAFKLKFCSACDGRSSQRFVEFFFENDRR